MSKNGDKKDVDQSFWKAMQKDEQAADQQKPVGGYIDLTTDLSELSPAERAQRKRALLSMLAASEARQQHVLKHRLPALTTGLVVAIKSGPFKHQLGTVSDADYIQARALLHIEGESEAQWLDFSLLAPVVDQDPEADTPGTR